MVGQGIIHRNRIRDGEQVKALNIKYAMRSQIYDAIGRSEEGLQSIASEGEVWRSGDQRRGYD